jgi:transcription elongation GreA/GreB family factor
MSKHREQIEFHVHWAKERGDFKESEGLRTELARIDEEIQQLRDELENFESLKKD